ncbi:MAG: hypothetical protein WBD34_02370 [Burkholderiaceae bacterium]
MGFFRFLNKAFGWLSLAIFTLLFILAFYVFVGVSWGLVGWLIEMNAPWWVFPFAFVAFWFSVLCVVLNFFDREGRAADRAENKALQDRRRREAWLVDD